MGNKRRIFLILAIAMLLIAIAFIWYALNHPEGAFPWNNSITYGIYTAYMIAMIMCFMRSK